MSRVKRRRTPKERTKAHDWELVEDVTMKHQSWKHWKCRKCGIESPGPHRPNLYALVNAIGSKAMITPVGPGMLCDEYTTWRVHES